MNEKIEKLKQLVRIEEYAEYMGYHVKRIGKYYTLEEHDSVRINPQRNTFFRNSCAGEDSYGSVINFVMHFDQVEYKEAVRRLEDYIGPQRLSEASFIKPLKPAVQAKQMLILPKKGKGRRHVYAYLTKQRCINTWLIDAFFEMDRLYEDENQNCVFVSYDEEKKVPDFACKRGTNSYIPFKGDVEGCDYTYCFRLPAKGGRQLYVAESVIDMMSIMTLMLQDGKEKKEIASMHFQALAGTQKIDALFHYLTLHPEIEEVYLGFDNDRAGREILEKSMNMGMNLSQSFYSFLPEKEGYDWNKVLQERCKREE